MLDNRSRLIIIRSKLDRLRVRVTRSKHRGASSISRSLLDTIAELDQIIGNTVPENMTLRDDLIKTLDSHITGGSIPNELLVNGVCNILDTLNTMIKQRDAQLGLDIKIPPFIGKEN